MFISTLPGPIRVVSREKLLGGGRHFGVVLWDGSVIHLTTDGVEYSFYDDFAQRQEVRTEHVAAPASAVEIMGRVREALERPHAYRFFAWNCEHFANWLVGLTAKSAQVDAAVLLGLAIVVARAAMK